MLSCLSLHLQNTSKFKNFIFIVLGLSKQITLTDADKWKIINSDRKYFWILRRQNFIQVIRQWNILCLSVSHTRRRVRCVATMHARRHGRRVLYWNSCWNSLVARPVIYAVYRLIFLSIFGTWRADVKICISSCTAHFYTVLMYGVIKHWKTENSENLNFNKSNHLAFRAAILHFYWSPLATIQSVGEI